MNNILFVCLLIFSFLSFQVSAQNFEKSLKKDWQLTSSKNLNVKGEVISLQTYNASSWLKTNVPTTVLGALIKNNIYKDVFVGKNLESIPKEEFDYAWWFRKEIKLTKDEINRNPSLLFEGIVYSANVWLNGKLIAAASEIKGAFRRFVIPIKENVVAGKNILAVEVFPAKPGDYNIGFVDWNPRPQDNSMGLWRSVKLLFNAGVEISDPYVNSIFENHDYSKVNLEASVDLTNHTDKEQNTFLNFKIGKTSVSKKVQLNPYETKNVVINSSQFPELKIKNPKLWWPNNLGDPNLYDVVIKVTNGDNILDQKEFKYGIREVKDILNEKGHKAYFINGQRFIVKGGGWVDDMFLTEDDTKLENQILYAKHMNLNTIRLEGFWGNSSKLYDLCDKHGMLLMVGWSCQWEWDGYLGKQTDPEYGGILEKEDIDFVTKYFEDHVKWLRNHPSILLWALASDLLPHPELEKEYLNVLKKYDQSRPFLLSAQMKESKLSGSSGAKMYGPYEYVPPVYWYIDTTNGGAYGFNTETGPGAQIPPLESLKKMIPKESLWPINDVWEYHCARHEFGKLDRFLNAYNNRYGEEKELEPFVEKAQIVMYEAIRPMFEAFQTNKFVSSGVIQWMLNSSWPKIFWQLYDYYLMPNGAFYGTKKACTPVNLVFNYGNNSIYLVNDKLNALDGLKATIKIYDSNSKEIFNQTISLFAEENSSKKIYDLPEIDNLTQLYFLDLKLLKDGKETSSNFYWLSKKDDVMDFEKTEWFYTPQKEYADFTPLNTLPKAKISYNYKIKSGDKQEVTVTLKNDSDKIAFFINVDLKRDKSNTSVLPVFWDDNYISLLPGETKVIKGKFLKTDLNNEKAKIVVDGWNTILN